MKRQKSAGEMSKQSSLLMLSRSVSNRGEQPGGRHGFLVVRFLVGNLKKEDERVS